MRRVGVPALLRLPARRAGFEPLTVAAIADDHKAYYAGAEPSAMRWTAIRASGRLLGVQLVEQLGSEIAKRWTSPRPRSTADCLSQRSATST